MFQHHVIYVIFLLSAACLLSSTTIETLVYEESEREIWKIKSSRNENSSRCGQFIGNRNCNFSVLVARKMKEKRYIESSGLSHIINNLYVFHIDLCSFLFNTLLHLIFIFLLLLLLFLHLSTFFFLQQKYTSCSLIFGDG
jgi:hypothetical protein